MSDSPSAASPQPEAARPPAPRQAQSRLRRRLLRPLGLVVGLALLFPAAAGTPDPISAAGSCTGWGSTTVPPNSIRVLRSATGAVETVEFRRYVLVVMGKEWGPSLPAAVLRAGAQASKQFAWYHSLQGNHRGGFSGGQCYDVRDSTIDQLYKPESVTIYDKQRAAVDAIWGLSLRKSGKFFLTQYRAGQSGVACGADANGKILYARSAVKCANAGWGFERILAKYYSPDLSFTWSDTSATGSTAVSSGFAGTVSVPRTLFRVGAAASGAALLTTWHPTNKATKIASYEIQRLVGGAWKTVGTQPANDRTYDVNVKWGNSQRFRIRARNSSGAPGAWSTGPTFTPKRTDDRSSSVRWSGTWKRTTDAGAVKGTTTTSKQAGASASLTFTGRSVALVGTRGPGRGQARIYINGNLVGTIDLYRSTKQAGHVLFSRSWAKSATRTIRVVVVGTSSRPRVDIDAFLYTR